MESPTKKKRLTLRLVSQQAGTLQINMLLYVYMCVSVKKVSGELLLLSQHVLFNLRMVLCCMLLAKPFELTIGNFAVKIKLVWLLCWIVSC